MKYKKKDLLHTIELLIKTNQAIKKSSSRQLLAMEEVLVDCQTTAIQIGTYLETLGEGTGQIVKILEDYCENIYQQSINLTNKDISSEISEKIQIQLKAVGNAIEYGLPTDKKEIVFLPYNASMWDSLESVWLAARDDESCEVYVVPIPFFDKNPDGSFGQMHYEGNEYPNYVQITSWEEYLIPERKPDVIYIHNPYDQSNHVTSVHPAFYSKELKKHTDMLVYIPYFVGINNTVQEHLCLVPAVLHAHRTIVESEAIKDIYLNTLERFEIENNCQGKLGDWKKKIVALGSPKLDQIWNLDEIRIKIPEDWKKKIYKNDGSKRSVVFYNTTIETLLNHSDIYLAKVEEVINIFSRCDDFVLLWRPHPLLESTLKSMRPDLHSAYKNILKKYITDNKGIFDETSDLNRAIMLSDMYYGDGSSVVTLYKATGKPIYLQSAETRGLAMSKNPFMLGLCEYNGNIYGVDYATNMLLRFDLEDKKIYYQKVIPSTGYDANQPYQSYHHIYREDGKLYLIPFRENQIVIWDMKEDVWETIPLTITERCTENEPGKFYSCIKYGDILYLLPFGYKKVLACNLVTKEQWFSFDFSDTVLKDDRVFFHPFEYIDNSNIVLTCFGSNHIVIMNLITGDCRIQEVGDKEYRFSTIKKIDSVYVILVKNKLRLLLWNPKTTEVREIKAFPNKAVLYNDRHCFDGETVNIFNKYIYCFPASCNMAVRIDVETLEIIEVEAMRALCSEAQLNHEISTFDGCTRVGNKLYLHYQLDKIVCFNMETEEVSVYERELVDSPEEIKMADKMFLELFNDNIVRTPKILTEIEKSKGEVIHGFVSKSLL